MQKLGDYIREVDVRNKDLKVTNLLGVNLNKQFFPSIANIIGTDLSKYKVIKKGQFGCKFMSVGRDGILPISLLKNDGFAIISSAYYAFEVIDENILSSDYLMMWLRRPEFDRQLWFYSGGDVRGGVNYRDFCEMPIIIPSIEQQREIVSEYETISKRIKLNEQIIKNLEATAQTLYHKMFVEGIDKENLPEGWRIGTIKELCEVRDGTHDSPNYIENGYPLLTSIHLSAWKLLLDKACLISEQDYNKINERSLVETKDILFSMIGTVGVISFVLYTNIKFAVKNVAIFKTSHNLYFAEYLLFFLKSKEMQILIKESMSGSTQNYITLNTLRDIPIIIPNKDIVKQFHNVTNKIVSQIWNITQDNEKLIELQSLLLAKMGK